MATLLLTAAGAALGGAALPAGVGFLGTTLSGAAIGSALGGGLGNIVDQRLFGPGATVREGPRLKNLDVVTSTEGAPIPRVFGRMRLGGQVIWATRFRETVTETTASAGGKGGGASATTRRYSYSVSVAIALCEGPIAGIGRIWADGQPMDLSAVQYRVHDGREDQPADPLIAALTSDAPRYAGTAYILFEDLPLEPYGNRVPQITVEVRRPPAPPPAYRDGPALPALIEGVALSPGSGEFALATEPVRRVLGEGVYASENLNNTRGTPDFIAALDQLQETIPACRSALLIVSWFGTDLRASHCQILPGTDRVEKQTDPLVWRVSGETRPTAHPIGSDEDGNALYGGTPADSSVYQAIREMNARGIEVCLYPFLLMDIPPGGSQPAYPWRGRIEAVDTAASNAFFGAAQPGDFGAWSGETIPYTGPADTGLRRMILHYAHLCAAAGGVESFCIGSELRGLTTSRDGPSYPAVDALRILARDVKAILPASKISYAADWSEYANHRPADGSVTFHLDPLWADPAIDFIGIDNYLPLADWRPGRDHLDATVGESEYDIAYLDANVEGGEWADWFYATPADRAAQIRTPITDGAHNEPWIYGVKALRDWWSTPHHDRPGGIRSTTPTAWVPGSKPVRFTETGCPAVDLGANQPNVFYDPKSSESAFPYHSRGVRDDAMQRRYLQVLLDHWKDDPIVERSYVWTWDTRPYPDYPLRRSVWTDGPSWEKGHWITGRLDSAPLAELVAEICAMAGETRIDVSRLHALVDGYTLDRTISARDALAPLMLVFGFDAIESDGLIRFIPRGDSPVVTLSENDLVAGDRDEPFSLTRAQETDLPTAVRLGHIRADAEYRRGAAEATHHPGLTTRIEQSDQAIALSGGKARAAARRWLAEARIARDSAAFALPPSRLALEPGDTIALAIGGRTLPHRIARLEEAETRRIEATRVAPDLYAPVDDSDDAGEPSALPLAAPALLELLDIPLLRGTEDASSPLAAASASPWTPTTLYTSPTEAGFAPSLTLDAPATLGRLTTSLAPCAPFRWSAISVDISLSSGALLSADRLAVLAGANTAALQTPSGAWEIVQFRSATLIAARTYRLTGFLRGQAGTEPLIETLPPGTRFVLIDNALKRLPLGPDDIAREIHLRYGPATQPFDAESYRATLFTPEGTGHRPYAPAHLRGSDQAGVVHVSWIRRTRMGGDNWQVEPPLGEETERYRITISANNGPVHEAQTSTPAYSWPRTAPLPLTVTVAQVSAITGPGHPAQIILA